MTRPSAPVDSVSAAIAKLAANGEYPRSARYLIGVSGGRDSMALLHALVKGGYHRLLVCHLDHGLRGAAAKADAKFVARAVKALGLECEQRLIDVWAESLAQKMSVETAARNARKAFFFDVAARRHCARLFLAHHADDQVETVLFNLCRGAGGLGVAGMPFSTEWNAAAGGRRKAANLRVLRPLLGVCRRDINAYVAAHQIQYREDASNIDPAHTRNRVRHEVIPLLDEVFGREASKNIWRAAEIIGEEEAYLQSHLAPAIQAASFSVELPWKPLSTAPVAEQRRILRAWLRARNCPGIGFAEIERTRQLLTGANHLAKVNLPGELCLRRRAGVLFVEANSPQKAKI